MNLRDPVEYIETYFKVLSKANERGIADLVPMKLWKPQKYYIENRSHRDIILKNRQQGSSTGVMALNTHHTLTNPFSRMSIVTHNQDTSEFLLQTVHRFLRNLPEELRPEIGWSSSARITMPKIDCYIYIDSAESKAIGVGHTLNIAHLSEFSRWPERKAADLYAGISQTVPAGGFITIESTPFGRGNLFYELYNAAKKGELDYKCFFFPWWWDKTCRALVKEDLTYTKEEEELVKHFELVPEQIAFRRLKIRELGDLFYQEYPENDVDCWLSSDISVFDGTAIRRYLLQVNDGREITPHLTIWEDVIGGESYVIGVDCASGNEKGDYSVASVIRTRNMKQVARLRAKMPPDLFAQELFNLGKHYNEALIGVEREMFGMSVLRVLSENDYPNIYYHQDWDNFTGTPSLIPGWRTTGKSKPEMIATFGKSLRAGELITYSENLLMEASSVIWDTEKKIKKPKGAYDDELDATMIALQLCQERPIILERKVEPLVYARW